MYFREVIELVSVIQSTDAYGDLIESETKSNVFADKQSIRQSEFYQAMATGLKPELMFVVRSIDYNDQTKLYYNSKGYRILRAYDKNAEFTELICQGITGTVVT